MGVNKVEYNTANGKETLIDLTGDTVTPQTLAEGVTAHDASGAIITGTATPVQLVQTTGNSETAVMSQKAITDMKNSGELNGERGTGILKVTTAPSGYTTAIGSYTPKYRIALSTVTSQSKVSKVMVGDVIQYSYYQYHVDYLDSSYAYISATRTSIRGATGATGATGAAGAAGSDGADGKNADELLLPPDYYFENDYLPGKIAEVKALMDEAGADGTAFIMFSDSHMGNENGGNSGKLAYHMMNECQIPHVLHFGDAGSNSPQETEELCASTLDAFNEMVKPLGGRLSQILGNHDGAWGLPVDDVTYPYNMARAKTFNRAMQKNRLGCHKVFSPDGTYYYIDDFGSHTRFIMLNTSDKLYETNENGTMTEGGNTMKGFVIRQAQVDWLIDSLNVLAGWYVVSCSHAQLHDDMLPTSDYIRRIFSAYRNKTTYAVSYAGQYGSAVSGYTNLFDASGEGYSLSGTTLITNFIPAPKGATVHIKAGSNNTPYKVHGYDSTKTKLNSAYFTDSTTHGAADYDSSVMTYLSGTNTKNGTFFAYEDWAYVTFEFRGTVPTDLIITVNENIEGSEAGSGGGENWDALSIRADFTGYKGDYIAHFCGHAHNDYWYKASSYLIDMVSVACDGRISNCSYMTDAAYQNRALGTVYEQCLDVVVINKAKRTIKTVRIGAGENREISY